MLCGCWQCSWKYCDCVPVSMCLLWMSTQGIVGLMKRPVSDRHQAEGGDVDDVFDSASIICHPVSNRWGQSFCRWCCSDSILSSRSLQLHVNLHVASLCLLCQISLPVSTCLTLPVPVLSVSQHQSCLQRRCCSAIMSTGKSTRLLRWSWAASWAERLPGGLTYKSN